MTIYDWVNIILFFAILTALTPLLGSYMAKVLQGIPTIASSLLGWLERLSYRLAGINSQEEMHWTTYLKALFAFNLIGFFTLFFIQIGQQWLPLNPQNFPNVPPALAFNTAASFVTNTNWQAYAGETTLSYFTQMIGLGVQNFLSAATGSAVLLALIRGITRRTSDTIGNFWMDLVRTVVYILIPLSLILAIILVSQGVIQNFSEYISATTLENKTQTIPMGPAASQIAIKQVGTNGGGFFNANSAHPFENPNAISNFLEMLAILLIPAAATYMFGTLIASQKHGWILYFLMLTLCISGLAISILSESVHNPILEAYPVLEGKETRFGITQSALWSVATTDASNGSTNASLTSLSPLAGGIAMFNIMLGESLFGGVGVGLASMIMFVLLTVFLAGLMVGRTPEYLGKKIEKQEMQWVMVSVLMPGVLILLGAGLASILPEALSSLSHQGPHGLSEILYAYASAAGNNGSAFTGLNANTTFFNLSLGAVMIVARAAIIVPSIAIAGLLARKRVSPASIGTFSVNTFLFAILLGGVILIVGALTFFPALSLGPIVEHILMLQGRAF